MFTDPGSRSNECKPTDDNEVVMRPQPLHILHPRLIWTLEQNLNFQLEFLGFIPIQSNDPDGLSTVCPGSSYPILYSKLLYLTTSWTHGMF